ncbi:MAG: hypothetical protein ACE5FI_01285 [Anaerolineales bacterium]
MAVARIDERARTLSALFAATDWPDFEQAARPHGVHAQANAVRRHVALFQGHPAAAYLQAAFNSGARNPQPYFALAMHLTWPDFAAGEGSAPLLGESAPIRAAEFGAHLRDFHETARLAEYWDANKAAWEEAAAAVGAHVADVSFRAFLARFLGEVPQEIVCIPNPLYPTQVSMGVATPGTLFCLVPPRRAVGESPPWPFEADREHVLNAVIQSAFGALLRPFLADHDAAVQRARALDHLLGFDAAFRKRYPDWETQLARLLTLAATALFLDEIDPGAGDSFTLFERRTSGLRNLPVVVLALRGYLDQQRAGNYNNVAEYLPQLASDVQATLGKLGVS